MKQENYSRILLYAFWIYRLQQDRNGIEAGLMSSCWESPLAEDYYDDYLAMDKDNTKEMLFAWNCILDETRKNWDRQEP